MKTIMEMNEIEFLKSIKGWKSWKKMSRFAQENIEMRIKYLEEAKGE